MSTIATFNRNNIDAIRKSINEKLAQVSKELGIALSIGGMNYSSDTITTRLTINAVGDNIKDGESIEEANKRAEFEKYAQLFGLQKSDFGKEVKLNNKLFRICGIAPKSRKYPILALNREDGKVYKLPIAGVQMHLSAVSNA